jgi:hypothetical protein
MVGMRLLRGSVVAACGLCYWLWALAALAITHLALAASEHTHFTEEMFVRRLGFFSWVIANAVVLGIALRKGRTLVGLLWTLQAGLLITASASVFVSGEQQFAPPLIVVGVIGQLLGLATVALRFGHNARTGRR